MEKKEKIVIESENYGEFEGATFEEAIKKAIETFAPYEKETFNIELIKVGDYYLHENSVKDIQSEIEHTALNWRKDAQKEYEGLREWTHPDTHGRI